MSPFVALHATARRHRDTITQYGLLLNQPTKARPFGVYVYRNDCGHPTRRLRRLPYSVWWSCGPRQDLWQAAYIGPMREDIYVENGWIFFDRIAPQHLSLITLITAHHHD